MYEKIVVGFKDDAQGGEALALARALVLPGSTEVVVASVVESGRHAWDPSTAEADVSAEVEHNLARSVGDWPEGVRASVRAIASGSAAGTLGELAEDEAADLLVLGSTHRGPVGRVLVGTTADELLRSAPCAVAVAPHGYTGSTGGLGTIGVAFDGSPESRVALAWAGDAARTLGLKVRAIMVVPPPPPHAADVALPSASPADVLEAIRDGVRGPVDDALDELAAGVPHESEVLVGEPAHELRAAAHEGIDAIVVGSRGIGPLKRVLVGSVSGALVRSCSVPVVVVPRPAEEQAPEGESMSATSA